MSEIFDRPIQVLIVGANGRMGQAVRNAVEAEPATDIGAQIDVGDDLQSGLMRSDVVIDFSVHHLTTELVKACQGAQKPIVIGTTGHSDDELSVVKTAASTLGIVMAPNFSVGVNTLFWLTAKAAEILGPAFDLEVIEMHHRMKIDAPSGTAKRLGEILAEIRDLSYADDLRHGRLGITGQRTSSEIGMHSLRGGDVVGDHTVVFANLGERVELTHKASSRDTFAMGAVRAAKWIVSQPAGLYDMQDVLNLK